MKFGRIQLASARLSPGPRSRQLGIPSCRRLGDVWEALVEPIDRADNFGKPTPGDGGRTNSSAGITCRLVRVCELGFNCLLSDDGCFGVGSWLKN